MKKYKIIIPILSVLAVLTVAAALLAPGYFKSAFSDKPKEQTTANFTLAQSKYTPMLTGTGALGFPPLQTDIPNLFYTINPADGAVAYYEGTARGLVAYKGTVETVEITVTCSYQKIPVKLYYAKQGGKTIGYGLFTATPAPTDVYAYAFLKLTDLPVAYGKGGQLLLVDFDKTNFWINDKLYTEAFIVNLNNPKAEPKTLTTDNSRTVDLNGAMRSDWVLFHDNFLEGLGNKSYFLSSRAYNLDQKGLVSDILEFNKSQSSIKTIPRAVSGILGLWARVEGDNLIYLKATDKGFDCLKFDGKNEQIAKSFAGNYFEDYLQNGNHLLHKKTLVLTNLLTGGEKTLTGFPADAVMLFSVSPDGSRALAASTSAGATPSTSKQTLALYNLETGTPTIVTEPLIFSQSNANFCWIDNNTLFHLRPTGDDATGLSYCIIKLI